MNLTNLKFDHLGFYIFSFAGADETDGSAKLDALALLAPGFNVIKHFSFPVFTEAR